MIANPAFVPYVVAMLLLVANLLFLWAYSGVMRTKTKSALNHEDAAQFKVAQVEHDPPEVARVLRAHANAMAMFVPFAALAFIMIMMNVPPLATRILLAAFVAGRWIHSFAYLRALQPWRTLSFVVSVLATFGVMAVIVWRLVVPA